MRRKQPRTDCIRIRLHAEEKELLRFNAGIQGLSIADYIRQNNLGFRLRQSPLAKARLRQLARIGVNLNQIAKWANTYKRSVEAVEVITALVSLERCIDEFMAEASGDDEEGAGEQEPCS